MQALMRVEMENLLVLVDENKIERLMAILRAHCWKRSIRNRTTAAWTTSA